MVFYSNDKQEKTLFEYSYAKCRFFDAAKRSGRPCSIKIINEKNEELNIACTDNPASIDEIKVSLENSQGLFEGCYMKKIVPDFRIEKIPAEKWKIGDVEMWLKITGTPDNIVKKFIEKNIRGSDLLELSDEKGFVKTVGVGSNRLVLNLEQLKRSKGMFSFKRFIVEEKLHKLMGEGVTVRDKFYEVIIDTLCDESMMKHHYLSTSRERADILFGLQYGKGNETSKIVPKRDLTNLPTLEIFFFERVFVKVIIFEDSSSRKRLHEIVSPVMKEHSLVDENFELRTAIVVGQWWFEWRESELVIPKRLQTGRDLACLKVNRVVINSNEKKGDITEIMADVVVRWNTRFKYMNSSEGGNSKLKNGNCQNFVDDMLESLGLLKQFGGAFGEFLKYIRKEGVGRKMEFVPSNEFSKYFVSQMGKRKTIEFKTHLEFDNFCTKIRYACLDVHSEFEAEWNLLKAFDRVFWARHLLDIDNKKYIPAPDNTGSKRQWATGCPFKHPQELMIES